MKIYLSPQVSQSKIEYNFDKDRLSATYKSKTDIFDFTEMPDGVSVNIETTLEINPILSAKKEAGILYLELVNFISEDASEEECFPIWKEV